MLVYLDVNYVIIIIEDEVPVKTTTVDPQTVVTLRNSIALRSIAELGHPGLDFVDVFLFHASSISDFSPGCQAPTRPRVFA